MARFSDLPALKCQYFPASLETVPLNMQPRLILGRPTSFVDGDWFSI